MDYSDDNDNLPRARRVKRDVEYDESLTCVPGSVMKAEGDLTKSLFKDKIFHNPWSTWNGESFKIRSILKLAMQKDHSNVPNSKVISVHYFYRGENLYKIVFQKLDEILPIMKPTFPGSYSGDGVRVTWIGHSTIVVQFDNVTVLTDPLFSSRASPSQLFGPKRYRQPACMIEDLPETLDAVVISHNHYDHLDVGSVNALKNRYGDQLRWYVPLNLKKWFNDLGVQNVVELDWWEEYCAEKGIKFVLTPAQHWSKRGLNDDFHSLWGSWSIIGPRNRFFFTGDTGYCPVFEEIGKVYGPFTAAAIPIGAYSPRWFMSPQHVDPQQAVQIHRDIRSKSSMAIHWGTFALAYEVCPATYLGYYHLKLDFVLSFT